MRKQGVVLIVALLTCLSAWAESNILSSASPKLRKFLLDHPPATKALTDSLAEAFAGKTYSLFYFYSDSKSDAGAYHFYPQTAGLPEVFICVREDQLPPDEFAAILFETLNSTGEGRFLKLVESAKAGSISRSEFAREIVRIEFEATKKTRDLLKGFKIDKKETIETHYWRRFIDCPDKFEEFLLSLVSHDRDVVKEYESKYDSLRRTP